MLVDDSLTVRTVFSRMIERENDMTIVAAASTAERGLEELKTKFVDVILLDLEMPGMGGIEALPKLLKASPRTKVLVISSLTAEGAEHTVKALQMGAADTMLKPRPGGFNDEYRDQLLAKIRALKGLAPHEQPERKAPKFAQRRVGKRPQVLAIGASTGGIHALGLFLRQVPKNFDLPILITQHLPASFIPVFAKQMEMAAGREAVLADEGTEVTRGRILIAPGHGHMVVRRKGTRYVTDLAFHPVKSGCTPSVDPMFETLAEAYEGKVAGILLSGMGRDGTEGADAIINAGGSMYAQSADTCAVWGMPRDITERGLASAVLPPEELADRVLSTAGADAWR
ncbi:chemotaxis-specific protein-glutamate methyltransferase CheB [Qipengyuania sp. 1NDH17]|uniref:protein-glutamate methylesterase n=2 Tax=Qipengyuania polymorpha TaxID=2867234 RepID=A0ABS7IXP4_9SPHN|nr:chemotaxis-specific protein-glutamate methyltransferase CheB [Qipengyuania polymorpha]MBX7458158.1 chemotaxis-specific protein-glutamate methyltransferase CheB [Qipengyuania polymorpha]